MTNSKALLIFLLIASSNSFLVNSSSSSLFLDEDQSSGLLDLGDGDDMFYWLFRSRDTKLKNTQPLVIWISGGPGFASQFNVFYTIGPYKINDDLTLTTNPYSWNEKANLLFVDEPFGTGFSRTTNPSHYAVDGKMAAKAFYRFLMKFYSTFPEFKERPLFITGESYAGHLIPDITNYIVEHPMNIINLKGIAIGNGWVSPINQYPAYADFAYENNLLSKMNYLKIKSAYNMCTSLIKKNLLDLAEKKCFLITASIIKSTLIPNFDMFDIRKKCKKSFCYDTTNLKQFLNLKQVKEELGIGDRTWSLWSRTVKSIMKKDNMRDLSSSVTNILDHNIRVLVYSGDQDFICNWRGNEAWVNQLEWTNKTEFNNQEYTKWIVEGKVAGEEKTFGLLSFLRIYDAAHFVPLDQPRSSLFMLDSFIGNNE